ncbi:MAG: PhoH family protein [Desulfobacterales bacterium]
MDAVYVTGKKRTIAPKNPNQKDYIDAIRNHDIVFGIGPAGTGKTYLAMAMAVAALAKKKSAASFLPGRPWKPAKLWDSCPGT